MLILEHLQNVVLVVIVSLALEVATVLIAFRISIDLPIFTSIECMVDGRLSSGFGYKHVFRRNKVWLALLNLFDSGFSFQMHLDFILIVDWLLLRRGIVKDLEAVSIRLDEEFIEIPLQGVDFTTAVGPRHCLEIGVNRVSIVAVYNNLLEYWVIGAVFVHGPVVNLGVVLPLLSEGMARESKNGEAPIAVLFLQLRHLRKVLLRITAGTCSVDDQRQLLALHDLGKGGDFRFPARQ